MLSTVQGIILYQICSIENFSKLSDRNMFFSLDNTSDTVYGTIGGSGIKTVLDTNIIFAGLYSARGASFQVLKALFREKIRPVLSVPLLFEYEDVLKRNSRKLGITHEDIDSFLDNVCNLCTFHEIYYLWRPFLRNPKDDLVLELAIAAQANTITTFNAKDFKGVDQLGIKILSPKQLLEEIQWEL